MFYLQLWNLVAGLSYHYTTLAQSQMKLCFFKVAKLDVCAQDPFCNSSHNYHDGLTLLLLYNNSKENGWLYEINFLIMTHAVYSEHIICGDNH